MCPVICDSNCLFALVVMTTVGTAPTILVILVIRAAMKK